MCKKGYIWSLATCSCKNGKCLASIIDNSLIRCDEIIETTKTVPTKSISTNFYILLTFLLITIILLVAVSIYLIKNIDQNKNIYWHIMSQIKIKRNFILIISFKMGNRCKEIDIKNRTYYFFNDMINIKNLDLKKIRIQKYTKSHTKILLFVTLDI